MVKRQRMQIGMKSITKGFKGQLKTTNWNIPVGLVTRFSGLSSPGSMSSGLNISRIVILLLLVPQIAQTKVAKSKGKLTISFSFNLVFTWPVCLNFIYLFNIIACFAYIPTIIQHWDSNLRSLGYKSSTLNTRPWLLALSSLLEK